MRLSVPLSHTYTCRITTPMYSVSTRNMTPYQALITTSRLMRISGLQKYQTNKMSLFHKMI